jgi:DNA (cytosine-5)-methyltransferase 1
MKHLDLFSGIGGFALACEWAGIETICFCEMDKFCQKVLKKHWPNVPIIEDVNNVEEIKRVIANAIGFNDERAGFCTGQAEQQVSGEIQGRELCSVTADSTAKGLQELQYDGRSDSPDEAQGRAGMDNGLKRPDSLILTASFPCQPFSNAGRKRGSSDDRYLWPQTLAVIEAVKPDWLILENVPGILNMVFPDSEVGVASQSTLFGVENDEICDYSTISGGIESGLRQAGYKTVWLVIPACSLGAPHRRDRVWIVGNATGNGPHEPKDGQGDIERGNGNPTEQDKLCEQDSHAADTHGDGFQDGVSGHRSGPSQTESSEGRSIEGHFGSIPGWPENWHEVATRFCRVDDGLPRVMDRVGRLKALGNAIVPQVAYELIKNILNI